MNFFSIIMPAFNVGDYISACIDSILKQTYSDFEIIIVDDESTDATLKIALGYAEKFDNIKVASISHVRVGAVRNKAIQLAKGKYLVFVDADDILEPQMFEKLHAILQEKDSDICYLPTHYVLTNCGKTKHELIKGLREDYYFPSREDFFSFVRQNKGTVPGSMWTQSCKRDLVISNNIDFKEEYVWSQDSDFCFQVLSAAKDVSICSYPGYCWNRMNIGSATQKVTESKVISRLSVYKKWYDEISNGCFGKISDSNSDYLKRSLLKNYYEVLQSYAFLKTRRERNAVKNRIEADNLLKANPELIPKHFKQHGLVKGRYVYLFYFYLAVLINKTKSLLRKLYD